MAFMNITFIPILCSLYFLFYADQPGACHRVYVLHTHGKLVIFAGLDGSVKDAEFVWIAAMWSVIS